MAGMPFFLTILLVWIHDYHLLLVPHMLRQKLPSAAIGVFIHAPFPSSEIFRCLPSKCAWSEHRLTLIISTQNTLSARMCRMTRIVVLCGWSKSGSCLGQGTDRKRRSSDVNVAVDVMAVSP